MTEEETTPHVRTQGENPKWVGNGNIAGPIRKQYLALVEAVGLPNAPHYMERFIEWPSDHRPPPRILRRWRQDALEENYEPDDRLVRKFRQQIRAYYEFKTWRSVEQMADTNMTLSKRAQDGELDAAKQVQLQYSGMNLAYTLREVSAAFGTPKPTAQQFNKFVMNMGEPPKPKLRSRPAITAPTETELPAAREIIDIEARRVAE